MPRKGGSLSLSSYDDIFETDESREEKQLERVERKRGGAAAERESGQP